MQNTMSIRSTQERKTSLLLSYDPLNLKSKTTPNKTLLLKICSEDLGLKYLGSELFLRFTLTILGSLNENCLSIQDTTEFN